MTSRRWLMVVLGAAAVLLIAGRALAGAYADYLWYESLGAVALWRLRAKQTMHPAAPILADINASAARSDYPHPAGAPGCRGWNAELISGDDVFREIAYSGAIRALIREGPGR